MKNLPFISFLLLICTSLDAQVYWQGGTPGRETDWMEPLNWSAGQVPGGKDDVVIPYLSHGLFPEIGCVAPMIRSLAVREGAALSIQPQGVLTVDAAGAEGAGLALKGHVLNLGALILTEMELASVESQLSSLENQGVCSLVADAGHIPLLPHENQ